MTRTELMKELKNMNVAFKATMKTAELEKLYNDNTVNDSFTELKKVLERNNITVLNETNRRIVTSDVMYCKRANNRVRAYLKKKANHDVATERNTQYDANILLDLNDDYIDYAIRRLYHR